MSLKQPKRTLPPPASCQICAQFELTTHISRALYLKHTECHNFYFVKQIDDIIDDKISVKTVRFRENLVADDNEEYLRRHYQFHEYSKKIQQITQYYRFQTHRPTWLLDPSVHNLMENHRDRMRDYEYKLIKKTLKQQNNISITTQKSQDTLSGQSSENKDVVGQGNVLAELAESMNKESNESELFLSMCKKIDKAFNGVQISPFVPRKGSTRKASHQDNESQRPVFSRFSSNAIHKVDKLKDNYFSDHKQFAFKKKSIEIEQDLSKQTSKKMLIRDNLKKQQKKTGMATLDNSYARPQHLKSYNNFQRLTNLIPQRMVKQSDKDIKPRLEPTQLREMSKQRKSLTNLHKIYKTSIFPTKAPQKPVVQTTSLKSKRRSFSATILTRAHTLLGQKPRQTLAETNNKHQKQSIATKSINNTLYRGRSLTQIRSSISKSKADRPTNINQAPLRKSIPKNTQLNSNFFTDKPNKFIVKSTLQSILGQKLVNDGDFRMALRKLI